MSCHVSVKVGAYTYEHFEVPEPVYAYIRQLENAVRHDTKKGLAALYPERFGDPFTKANEAAKQWLFDNFAAPLFEEEK